MAGQFEKAEKIPAPVEIASRAHVARNPEVADFESFFSDLSAVFIRVSVDEIDSNRVSRSGLSPGGRWSPRDRSFHKQSI